MIPAVQRLVSHVTAPPRLNTPRAESGGTSLADARVAQFRAKARSRTIRRGLPARIRLSRASIPPGEALTVARVLLLHPPLMVWRNHPK